MCYSDWPAYPAMQFACPSEQQKERFDCGHDDYFSTSPAAGSYLDTHWNTANNRFLIGAPNAPNRPPSQPLPPQIGVETKKGRGSAPDSHPERNGQCQRRCAVHPIRGLHRRRLFMGGNSAPRRGTIIALQLPWKLPKSGTFSFFAQATYVDGTTAISEPLTMNQQGEEIKVQTSPLRTRRLFSRETVTHGREQRPGLTAPSLPPGLGLVPGDGLFGSRTRFARPPAHSRDRADQSRD